MRKLELLSSWTVPMGEGGFQITRNRAPLVSGPVMPQGAEPVFAAPVMIVWNWPPARANWMSTVPTPGMGLVQVMNV